MKIKSTHPNGKYCSMCGFVRPLDEFNRNKNNNDGHSTYCKEHERQSQRESYHRNKEQVNEIRRMRYAEKLADKKNKVCTCNDYRNCIPCRNRERKLAYDQNRIPSYVLEGVRL